MNFRTAITLQALKLAAVVGLYAMTVPVLLGVSAVVLRVEDARARRAD